MTSPISSYLQSRSLPDTALSSVTKPPESTAAAVPAGEEVTLTSDAQISADLLEAARTASGVDHSAVESLKAQMGAGTYEVSPETLAASILAANTETRS
ncbi:flagellar biosynthesis anti-sigma factor FlgM [Acidisoma sp.]|uniref:flagellar biosynthesis anti-sigma factor FlgM n=1 Tax=Acidisoma sp. TaxID=1872115 RepID=UPI003AFFFBDE